MNILGIDTSTKTMSVALVSDNKILGELNFYSNMDHSERLIDNISFLLKSNDMTIKDIDLVGVAVGPGSFTGIRIGIATAKGLCEFSKIPIVGVSSLEALSRNFSSSAGVCVLIDAKRDRAYGGIYDYSRGEVEFISEDLFDTKELLELVEDCENIILVGDLNDKIREAYGDKFVFAKEGNLLNHASNICFIAKRNFENGNYISHKDLQANYMTKSQAQIDFEKKNG